jgi:inner membrane protein
MRLIVAAESTAAGTTRCFREIARYNNSRRPPFMDLLTHALAGAATAMLAARQGEIRTAAIAGGVAALLPDADALIRSSTDALVYFEYHRYFTHSLMFIPVGALLAAAVLRLAFRLVPFVRVYLFCVLGIALAGVLDACTSYGTHLLWPFVNERIAWNIISVLDPVFMLLLAVPAVLALRAARQPVSARWATCGLALGSIYLATGVLQHQRSLQLLERYASEQALSVERLMVKPTIANLLLWRGMIQTAEHIHVAALRPGIIGPSRIYPGERAARLSPTDIAAVPEGSRLRSDIERFSFFSDELLTHSGDAFTVLGDARYSMRPDSLRPIWSIRFDVAEPDRPVSVVTDREMSPADRTRFMQMLRGAPQ